jgi:hypothetical protein
MARGNRARHPNGQNAPQITLKKLSTMFRWGRTEMVRRGLPGRRRPPDRAHMFIGPERANILTALERRRAGIGCAVPTGQNASLATPN